MAILHTPKNTLIDAYLRLSTGTVQDVNQQTELARLPLPPAEWTAGITTLRAQDASTRILPPRASIPANHRTASLHISLRPVADCAALNLRWQHPAAVVVRALTAQPYQDW